ncbi:glycosyl transferase [Morganella morganii]|nr:glycosyl transferase [Morganella morganii]
MLIPKKIHYCWYGNAELPELAIKCIDSWKVFCPDYEIIRWDESNSDLESCQFVREAYSAQKWAFVSDYMRLKVVEEHGGIYLDTDVELIQSLDQFLIYQGFMGFEQSVPYHVATGLGFGAVPHHPLIIKLKENYEQRVFVKENGVYDMEPCPKRDTKVLVQLGLEQIDKRQTIQGIEIFPTFYFCPISQYGIRNFKSATVSIHHFNASWFSDFEKIIDLRKKKLINIFGNKIGGWICVIHTVHYSICTVGVRKTLKKIFTKLFSS